MFKAIRILTAIIIALTIILSFTVIVLAACLYEGEPIQSSSYQEEEFEVVKKSQKQIESVKQSYYQISSDERELLAKLVHCEASICNKECKYAVLSVVFNRLESGKWGDTLQEVIYYKNAFTPATSGKLDKTSPTKGDYAAVDYIIENGPTLPTYVRYFRTDYDFKWKGYKNYKVIDSVHFGYFEDWQNGAW